MSAQVVNRAILWMATIATLIVSASCANPTGGSVEDAPPPEVKPMERVRAGIVTVRDQLQTTISSAEAAVADPGNNVQQKRARFRDDLRDTQSAVKTLRADAVALRERADEFLALWSDQSFAITPDGGVYPGRNVQRERSKAKYDQMVGSLQEARDVVSPLMTDLEKLQRSIDNAKPDALAALQPDVTKAVLRGKDAVVHLNAGLTSMDELKAMLTTRGTDTR